MLNVDLFSAAIMSIEYQDPIIHEQMMDSILSENRA